MSGDTLGCSVMLRQLWPVSSHLCCGEMCGVSVWGQWSVPSLLLLRLFGSLSEGCGEEKVLSVLLWRPAPWGGERLARPCWCSVKFLCGEEISSRWMKCFEAVNQLGGGKEGNGREPRASRNWLLLEERGWETSLILWKADVEPLVLATADPWQCRKEGHVGFKAAGSLRTSSKGLRSSSALECLPPLDSSPSEIALGWLHLPVSSAPLLLLPAPWDAAVVHAL